MRATRIIAVVAPCTVIYLFCEAKHLDWRADALRNIIADAYDCVATTVVKQCTSSADTGPRIEGEVNSPRSLQ